MAISAKRFLDERSRKYNGVPGGIATATRLGLIKSPDAQITKPIAINDRFSKLKTGLAVAVHTYGDRKKIEYRGVITEDLVRNRDATPKSIKIKVSHAPRDTSREGQTISLIYAQTGKANRRAWIVAEEVAVKKGTKIKKIFLKQYDIAI